MPVHFGNIDVLINNAGYGLFGAIEEMTEKEARDQMGTNFFGLLWLSQAILPVMREQGHGHIIQLSSVLRLISRPVLGLYAAFQNGFLQTQGLPNMTTVSAQLNLSARYLSDLSKQETGKTTIELIHIHLINEAKNRLRTNDQRVSEIAYEPGLKIYPISHGFLKRKPASPLINLKKIRLTKQQARVLIAMAKPLQGRGRPYFDICVKP